MRAPGPHPRLAAVRRVQLQQHVPPDQMTRPNEKDPPKPHPLKPVVFYPDPNRLHIRIRVIHHNSKMSKPVIKMIHTYISN
jgi:hypothetical protein